MVSICISLVISGVLLTISFVMYKKQTAKDHAEEAEQQKRQQHLRYLASLQHYQNQMDVQANTPLQTGMARRRSSMVRLSRASNRLMSVPSTIPDDSEDSDD